VAALAYLALGVVIWGRAWVDGASTHTLCGCGDPALFLWFFQWPATAVAHGYNPFYSTALFHPQGINLLAQTSVMGLSVPLIPVTWLFGPVAALNVASTLTPALGAFFAYLLLRRWVDYQPAAFIGGLFFGFSPFVLSNLQFAHLMSAALMLLPLILGVLDEILLRQKYSPRLSGAALGVLLFLQFFLSTEILAIIAVLMLVCGVVLVGAAFFFDPPALRRLAPHALGGLLIGGVLAAVLLAFPIWYALDGPAHLSGLVWPNIGGVGGYVGSSFVDGLNTQGENAYAALGGYDGMQLPSSAFLGWGLIAVIVVSLGVWWRDRRMWFYAFLLGLCVVCSLGAHYGQPEPAFVFIKIPVIQNVIEQRFMAVGFLAAAVLLTLIIDKTHAAVKQRAPRAPRPAAAAGSFVVALAALLPVILTFGPRLPFNMDAVVLPRWYTEVAPKLPPGRVLLNYPVPYSGVQVAMAWQAVNGMNYSQAGGGGPEGLASRAGSAKAGFTVIGLLGFGLITPPTGTPAQLAATRHALVVWRVNTVVIATNPTAPALQQGHNPTYAAGFMTAALGRLPTIEAGAWVWNDVTVSQHAALRVPTSVLADCAARAEKENRQPVATMQVPNCVGLAGLHDDG
jgi:hypothetical protein